MATTLHTRDTGLHADCVESCPIDGFEDTMAVGTYHLTKHEGAPDTRSGTIALHFLHENQTDGLSSIEMVDGPVAQMDSGVFDMKWSFQRVYNQALVGVATAGGTLDILALSETRKLVPVASASSEGDAMFISLDWNNRVHAVHNPQITVSQSNGFLSVWQLGNSALEPLAEWRAHDLFGSPIEVWITAWNYHDTNLLYSGGDDAMFKGWDVRATARPTFIKRDVHTMGVCSIQTHPLDEHVVAVGSYDENITLWDTRQFKQPTKQFSTGGGVWRLKWHPRHKSLLLAACMHNGFQILDIESSPEPAVLSHYTKQTSLAYGVDWWYKPSVISSPRQVVGSASFYDHSFHVWQVTTL
ncbi:hypothetical protein Ae201684_017627 [Aphanomyces euteiches]|uniref:methylated diphthine methylhydrolase n=1 Tax=Aphanomyces euteiches TaxID=100861 RepID=A0A6G0W8J1_9STRA|nr:hypothetical protein Ae201684_017627 [Aphanomyces euteiches]